MIAIKTVNGKTPVIEPDTFDVSTYDLYSDSTGRGTENGVMIAHLIRADIYKIDLSYTGTADEIRAIRNLYSIASQWDSALTVEFLDLDTYVTKRMYPGDRNQSAIICTKNGDGRYTLSLSLTEY